jgi:hypothetical protein
MLCLALIAGALVPSMAQAQQRIVAIPADATRAVITFTGTPDVALNGNAARLSPGARIYDRNNYLQMFGSLSGSYVVKVQFEALTGLVQAVWILTDSEIAQPDPSATR